MDRVISALQEACGIAFEKEDYALAGEIDETISNLKLQEKEGSLWYFEHALVPALEFIKTSKDHIKAVEHLEAMTSPSRLLPQFREELKYWKKEIATGQSRGRVYGGNSQIDMLQRRCDAIEHHIKRLESETSKDRVTTNEHLETTTNPD
jgi:hypothetical protein